MPWRRKVVSLRSSQRLGRPPSQRTTSSLSAFLANVSDHGANVLGRRRRQHNPGQHEVLISGVDHIEVDVASDRVLVARHPSLRIIAVILPCNYGDVRVGMAVWNRIG